MFNLEMAYVVDSRYGHGHYGIFPVRLARLIASRAPGRFLDTLGRSELVQCTCNPKRGGFFRHRDCDADALASTYRTYCPDQEPDY